MMKERALASAIIWLTYSGLVWLTITPFGVWSILMAFVLMMPLAVMMGMMWNSFGGTSQHSHSSGRSLTSVIVWLTYSGLVWFTITPLGLWSILMAFVLMMPLAVMMGMMWGVFTDEDDEQREKSKNESQTEKRKRDRLDAVLRDLSSDELIRLKRRLEDGTIDDDLLEDMIVGDDGELQLRG